MQQVHFRIVHRYVYIAKGVFFLTYGRTGNICICEQTWHYSCDLLLYLVIFVGVDLTQSLGNSLHQALLRHQKKIYHTKPLKIKRYKEDKTSIHIDFMTYI